MADISTGVVVASLMFFSAFLIIQAAFESNMIYKHRGVRGVGTLLSSETVRSRLECARLCMSENDCTTFNLGPEDDWTRRMECELVARNCGVYDVSDAGAQGWTMHVREGR